MNLLALRKSRWTSSIVVMVLVANVAFSVLPAVAYAQSTSAATQTTGAAQTTNQPQANGSWCEGWLKAANPMCWVRGISVGGSMIVIYLSGLVLGIAGVLMNASIDLTTVGFDSQIYARIQNGIEAVWTVFRDIANILIIGMFTFIALTMILGIEKFNARQMVAKVLLIAILINFSLLFTRLIIAASNFLAIQFYKAAQFGVEPSSALGAAASFGNYTTGISGKFAQLMGVTSALQTGDALWKAELGWWDPGFMTLALGALTAIVMIAAALMFFYIAFLLIARTLLFIFLLITSSLAFASYLIPGGGGFAGYGWDSWWKSLLKNAVFAPLLLMLLWATIQIGNGIKAISGSGTLGGLLADPTKGGNINALFCYILILGMLYISVKIATKFSHEVGGFNYATMFAGIPLALGARFAGAAARYGFGRGAGRIGNAVDAQKAGTIASYWQARSSLSPTLTDAERTAEKIRLRQDAVSRLKTLDRIKGAANYIADSKFDAASTSFGKKLLKGAGVPDLIAGGGKSVKSDAKYTKEIAEEAAKHAAEIAKPSSDHEKAATKAATDELRKQREVLERGVALTKQNIRNQENNHQDIRRFQEEAGQARGRQIEIERNRSRSAEDREALMRQEQAKINTAQSRINQIRRDIRRNSGLVDQEAAVRDINQRIAQTSKEAVRELHGDLREMGEDYAADYANRRWKNTIPWALGSNPDDDYIAQKARSEYKKRNKEENEGGSVKRALQRMIKEENVNSGGGTNGAGEAGGGGAAAH